MERVIYRSFKPVHYPITPEIHDAICRVYQTDSGNGQVKALAMRIGYPRWKISRYARHLGLIPKQKKEPEWSEAEISLLTRHAHRCPEVIQRKLKSRGYNRSITGIVLKRKRLRLIRNLDGMSSRSLAVCLGVDSHFVTRAIEAGKLKAERRGTKRTQVQGGDFWYIIRNNARKYIRTWINEIDIRKVDKYWFVDLLSTRD